MELDGLMMVGKNCPTKSPAFTDGILYFLREGKIQYFLITYISRILLVKNNKFFNLSQLDCGFTMRINERLAPFTYFNFFLHAFYRIIF
jgi:hypothetical protein